VHISDIAQIFLPPRFCADSLFPPRDELENPAHDRSWKRGRSLWEAADKLVEKFLCGDLEVHWVTTGLNQRVEKRQRENCYVWIPMVGEACDAHGGISRAGRERQNRSVEGARRDW